MQRWVKKLAHIGYQVSNIECSLQFYNALGFVTQQRFSKLSATGTIEVAFIELQGITLELYQLPQTTHSDMSRCGIDHIALEVSDLHAVQHQLQVMGYPLDEGPIHESYDHWQVDFLLIRGPDGERLEFDQIKIHNKIE